MDENKIEKSFLARNFDNAVNVGAAAAFGAVLYSIDPALLYSSLATATVATAAAPRIAPRLFK